MQHAPQAIDPSEMTGKDFQVFVLLGQACAP
jgi:hypothetical protein